MNVAATRKIAVIGAGAGGLMAAIAAGVAARMSGEPTRVTVYEAATKPGKSILRSGNGRCNFTNDYANMRNTDFYNQPSFVLDAELQMSSVIKSLDNKFIANGKAKCSTNSVKTLMDAMGVVYDSIDHRTYPRSRQATTVLGVLLRIADLYDVQIQCGRRIESIELNPQHDGTIGAEGVAAAGSADDARLGDASSENPTSGVGEPNEGKPGVARIFFPDCAKDSDNTFTIYFEGGEAAIADKVIVATGGGDAIPGAMGQLKFMPTRPVLGSLEVEEKKLCSMMDNMRLGCRLSVVRRGKEVFSEAGEVLFRKYGLSGIVAFNVSRELKPGDTVKVDFFPEHDSESLYQWMLSRLRTLTVSHGGDVTFRDFLYGLVPDAAVDAILRYAQADAAAPVNKTTFGTKNNGKPEPQMAKVLEALKGWPFTYVGIADPDRAQVMRGGVAVDEVFSMSLECKDVRGLYVVGEALDVDGPCGGWNLHWAFISGFLAGTHAARVGHALEPWGRTTWTF